MKKLGLLLLIILWCAVTVSSCAFFRGQLDRMSGFSNYLEETERYIRNEQWQKAAVSLDKATKAWYRIKPYLQVDIDHDYVNDIEADFIRLRGNIETGEKPNSLALVLLIRNNWRNIGSM